jgi:hypothetical protein
MASSSVQVQAIEKLSGGVWSHRAEFQDTASLYMWEGSPEVREQFFSALVDNAKMTKGGKEISVDLVAVRRQGLESLVLPFKTPVTFRTARAWVVRHLPPPANKKNVVALVTVLCLVRVSVRAGLCT